MSVALTHGVRRVHIQCVYRFVQVVLGSTRGVVVLDVDDTLLQSADTSLLCDAHAPIWIDMARAAGWEVIGCTARASVYDVLTRHQLARVGIVIDPMLFTDGYPKGPSVVNFLLAHGIVCPVVVVDDNRDQLLSIASCVASHLPDAPLHLYQFFYIP